jgi:hypothetical protein
LGIVRGILVFLFLATAAGVSCQEENAILWDPGHRLKWSDFKAEPQENSPVAAITASGISYRFSAMDGGKKMEVDCSINTFFYPESSWYRPELASQNILSHEQLHFDISELFARKMRARVERFSFTSDVKAEMNQIYEQILKELQSFQKRYDEETNFSRKVEKQIEWNNKIAQALQARD